MDQAQYEFLLNTLKAEVKPALGCTGPISICYCAAEAADAVKGGEVKRVVAKLDWGFGTKTDDVAFPGTPMLGTEMAVAMGVVCGDPSLGLEVMRTATPEGELKARKVAELVEIQPQWDRDRLGLYVDVTVVTDIGVGHAVFLEKVDGLILKERDGQVLYQTQPEASFQEGTSPLLSRTIRDYYDFASCAKVEDLELLKQAIRYNTILADATLSDHLGAGIGATLYKSKDANMFTRAKAYAAAGCEARMSGYNSPAMSCGNKGNVGLAASLPLISLARDMNLEEGQLLRAIALSYLSAISVIYRLGKSPAMCSCEVAACIGIAAGATFLQGGTYEQVENAISCAIPNIFGVVCDGARLACAMRISSGTSVALEAATLALAGVRFPNNQGVLAKNADESIDLLGKFGLFSMVDSDRELGKLLFEKRKPFPLVSFTDRQKQ